MHFKAGSRWWLCNFKAGRHLCLFRFKAGIHSKLRDLMRGCTQYFERKTGLMPVAPCVLRAGRTAYFPCPRPGKTHCSLPRLRFLKPVFLWSGRNSSFLLLVYAHSPFASKARDYGGGGCCCNAWVGGLWVFVPLVVCISDVRMFLFAEKRHILFLFFSEFGDLCYLVFALIRCR